MSEVHDCGFLIHRRPYRETSLLVEVFSHHHGCIALVARGALRRTRSWGAQLQPFQELALAWRGRGELHNLTYCETTDVWSPLAEHRLLSAFYVNELVQRLSGRGDPNEDLYQCYRALITNLGTSKPLEPLLRQFEVKLLACCGYGMNLTSEGEDGTPIRADNTYYYRVEHGASTLSGTGLGGLEVDGATLLALAGKLPHSEASLRTAKQLMRYVLSHYLGPKPIAARSFFAR